MQKQYLIISIAVTLLGIAFTVYPQHIDINLAPEHITLWEDSSIGTSFNFNTGEHSIDDGIYPIAKVWSEDSVTLNTTFHLSGMNLSETFNVSDNPSQYHLPGEGTWNIVITGNIPENTEETVYAEVYYLRLLEPERVTYYPYKFFGYGMTAIGLITSLVINKGSTRKKPTTE